jgi:signal transduction histidine kinase
MNDSSSPAPPANPLPAPVEPADNIAPDVAAANLSAVPKFLDILCNVSGARCAAVARVSDGSWTAGAVRDGLELGLVTGDPLDMESLQTRGIESYISVPIVLPGGRCFGNLCALDRVPASRSEPRTLALFTAFAELIGTQLQLELEREQERAAWRDERAAGELRDRCLAILGHDLRNPLQAVSATAALLERRLSDAVLIGLASRIRSSVRRMSALIDDALDFARGRLGGGIGVDIKICTDVGTSLVRVVEELKHSNPERQILLDAGVTCPVSCDLDRVQQLLANLVSNALEFGAADSPVKVTVRNTDDDLVLEVWNAGEPIPAESLGKIFEPFWQQPTAANRKGLGLGLHICSQIVRAHGGTLTVASTKENGTRFTAHLPLRPRASFPSG